MKKILIIEDDKAFLDTLITALEMENFKVLSSMDGGEGYQIATQEKFDLIVMDLMLPTMTGMEICKELRKREILTPIMMLSGKKKEEVDKVLGLELGADDYLLKPFGIKEFLARINAILRRTQARETDIAEFAFGDVYIHFKKQIARKAGKDISLTSKEFGLLQFLISHEGEVVSRNTLLNKVWGYDKYPTTRTVDTFVHNIRKKIEDDPSSPAHLITIPWTGYKFQK